MTSAAALSLLRARWRIPLVATPMAPTEAVLAPAEFVDLLRALLDVLDARVTMAVALWLSLLEDLPRLPAGWSEADRRRVAYLADMARCLRLQRGHGEVPWSPSAVAGIEPASWPSRLPLFESVAPSLPASLFGRRWGILEVVDAADYAGFQRLYLTSLTLRGEAS